MAGSNLRNYLLSLMSLTSLTTISYGSVDVKGIKKTLDDMINTRRYYSAAELLTSQKGLLEEPVLVRRYIDLLTNDFIYSINGDVFVLKDLEGTETVEQLRGQKGTFKSVAADPAQLLARSLNTHPASADIHFAIGQYLSFMATHFSSVDVPEFGNPNEEYDSYLFAYNKGIYDWLSLFRLATRQMADSSKPLKPAEQWLLKSYSLNAAHVDTSYDLAGVYFWEKDYADALEWVNKVIGRYTDPSMNGDAYHLRAKIFTALDRREDAEHSFLKALEIYPGHEKAFKDLLALYRVADTSKYRDLILKNVQRDYSNTLFLNYYLDFLHDAGHVAVDQQVEQALVALPVKTNPEIGALYFSLGKLALLRDDKKSAEKRLTRALKALRTQPKPPEGSVEATTELLNQIRSSGNRTAK